MSQEIPTSKFYISAPSKKIELTCEVKDSVSGKDKVFHFYLVLPSMDNAGKQAKILETMKLQVGELNEKYNQELAKLSLLTNQDELQVQEECVAQCKQEFIESEATYTQICSTQNFYTQEEVNECKGRRNCFNCNQKIIKQIFFYPIEYTKYEEFIVSPIPHCRPECALHSVRFQQNNSNLLSYFHLMYGINVSCAIPRELLFLPGGLTLKQYHAAIDEKKVVQPHNGKMVKAFLAPTYYSCTIFKDHQLSKDAQDIIEEMSRETKNCINLERSREENHPAIIMPVSSSFSTLRSSFVLDPLSQR